MQTSGQIYMLCLPLMSFCHKKIEKRPLKEKQHKKADENDLTPFS